MDADNVVLTAADSAVAISQRAIDAALWWKERADSLQHENDSLKRNLKGPHA